ncbi:MAG: hypothetical protein P4L40_07160 [Terracidiphilus sp.]|nr:hypothetical protein [Terracidiphilus sp.]
MLELCRKTIDLFRTHPVLWLPYVAADLAAQFVWWVRGLAERAIFELFATARTTSVLGGSYSAPRLDYGARVHALLAYAPIGLVAIYLCIASFVAAFALTGETLDFIREEKQVQLAELLSSLGARRRSILLMALIFPLVLFLLGAAITGPTFAGLRWAEHTELLRPLTSVAVTVAFGATMWLLLPRMLRLVRSDAHTAISSSVRWQGTAFAVVAMALEFALGILLQRVEAGLILDSRAQVAAVTVVNGLVSNMPVTPLFILLALLAGACSSSCERSANQGSAEKSQA